MNCRMLSCIGFAMLFALSTSAGAKEPDAKTAEVKRLLILSGSATIGMKVLDQMITSFQTAIPTVPQKFWEDFKKQAKPEALVEIIIPVYEKHFTIEEIRELIKFYESPIGKKLVSELPGITQESMTAGQKWGEQIARNLQERLKKDGYLQ